MVDDIDRRIIGALQDTGRRSNACVARELGLAEATVRRRIDRLLEEGIITIAVIPDEPKLGMNHHVLLGFRCDLNHVDQVLESLYSMQNLRWVGRTMGPYQVFAEAYFPNAEFFHEFYLQDLTQVPGIQSIETITVLMQPKRTYDWRFLMEQAAQAAERPIRHKGP